MLLILNSNPFSASLKILQFFLSYSLYPFSSFRKNILSFDISKLPLRVSKFLNSATRSFGNTCRTKGNFSTRSCASISILVPGYKVGWKTNVEVTLQSTSFFFWTSVFFQNYRFDIFLDECFFCHITFLQAVVWDYLAGLAIEFHKTCTFYSCGLLWLYGFVRGLLTWMGVEKLECIFFFFFFFFFFAWRYISSLCSLVFVTFTSNEWLCSAEI